MKQVQEEMELEPMTDWVEKIKRVNIANYQLNDQQYYEQVMNEVYDLIASEKVSPFISKTFKLGDVNRATNFINSKKCLGHVLINVRA